MREMVARKNVQDAELRALALQASETAAKREAELAAMKPKERRKAIAEWAKGLAKDVADLND
jgi:hypothetical protein